MKFFHWLMIDHFPGKFMVLFIIQKFNLGNEAPLIFGINSLHLFLNSFIFNGTIIKKCP